jgi:8-oxo-dGTP diphosphatase
MPADIFAAGGLVWRTLDGETRLGVVQRARYGGDVSIPKGKLERGESLRECALREVAEELGVVATLGDFAGLCAYRIDIRDKYVLYWEMDWHRDLDQGPDGVEVVGRRWITPAEALAELTYDTERQLLAEVLNRRSAT